MINKKVFLIGSRKSLLAREQTKIVIRQLKKIGFNNIKVKYILSKLPQAIRRANRRAIKKSGNILPRSQLLSRRPIH